MARNAVAHGATPMITLEFWDYREETTEQPEYSLARIASGAHDAYLRQFARDAKALEHPILLRPLHEMNGSWYPWCGTVNGNSPSEFIPAWRHVCDVFREEGADNVRFVWCPDATSVPNVPENSVPVYWPGESYVDYVALDGYNRGVPDSWRSFSEIFGPAYELVASLTDRPLFVAETGCAEAGGDKAVWIAEMFRDLTTTYPRITGIVWFNRRKERDWRIESSAGSLAAYREGAQRWAAAAPSQ
jgi:beta-mannanase